MSRVVKGVGRAVSKVVRGVANVAKKVVSSKIGKVLVGAALVYFGGAALMGAMGSGAAGAAGLSGLSGAATNISAAWTSLGTAAGQAYGAITGAEGASFANAGEALSSGFGGSAATIGESGGMLVNGTAPVVPSAPAAGGMSPRGLSTAADSGFTGQTMTGLPTVPGDAANVAANQPGLINRAADWFTNLKPSQQVLVAQMGGGLLSTGLKAYGAYQTGQDQLKLQEDARRRYNANIGGYRYGG